MIAQHLGIRCSLASDDSAELSLIPMHGLAQDWAPVVHDEEIYYNEYPGFLTTKNGPKISNEDLDAARKAINSHTGLSDKDHNLNFNGEISDQNLFAKIVRGEIE